MLRSSPEPEIKSQERISKLKIHIDKLKRGNLELEDKLFQIQKEVIQKDAQIEQLHVWKEKHRILEGLKENLEKEWSD